MRKIYLWNLFFFLSTLQLFSHDVKDFSSCVSRLQKLQVQEQIFFSQAEKWLAQYQKEHHVIYSGQNRELHYLMKQMYKILAESERIKKQAHHMETDEDSSSDESKVLASLICANAHLITFNVLSFTCNHVSHDKTLMAKLNELKIGGVQQHWDNLLELCEDNQRKKDFIAHVHTIQKHGEMIETLENQGVPYVKDLSQQLNSPLANKVLSSQRSKAKLKNLFSKKSMQVRTRFNHAKNGLTYHLVEIFSNTAGSIRWQSLLKSIDREVLVKLSDSILMPGDIILEKTKGAMTDRFIPGYWGHVAIFIGRPEQWITSKSLSLDSSRYRHLKEITAGNNIIEAVRPQVRLGNLKDWKVSDIAVIRPVNYPPEYIAYMISQALKYVGTGYDYNFDINTSSRVTCSELPYQAYPGIRFRVKKSSGRYVIVPDDIAALAGNKSGQSFKVIFLHHENQTIKAENRDEIYVRLLNLKTGHDKILPEETTRRKPQPVSEEETTKITSR
ncbi:hypothetical protein LA303_07650 [Candidatus Sulfidibacterium hydrothermale]|uniref:YiiX/YebB-like N1pC/P60 family cysteine hydrolase n=1 Tax=Candidatus Sulfidibacterium hydrothermale TaxID=2875962 RepID=UPI001F0AA002|nr:YiiX/YebB-like N1pC/P60 family cysteine hydrolase [Candidatus Sulfidibacterium hydrothermale]UBM61296.1 hypothetical protein LA303_07650 [Candidatus Sulfidibacterium hydrothermale]